MPAFESVRTWSCSGVGQIAMSMPADGAGLAWRAFFVIECAPLSMELQMNRKAFYFRHFSFPRPLAEETA